MSTPAYGGFVGGKFDAAKLPEDCAKVRQYYQNGGYFDAKVAPEVLYSDNRKWIKLLFHVQEGLHYKIRNINMMGNTRFPTAELLKDIKTHEGEYYNGWVINKDVLEDQEKIWRARILLLPGRNRAPLPARARERRSARPDR